jgi:hypothetical protein
MATNFKYNWLIVVISLTTLYGTCRKQIDCSQTDYAFKGDFKVYPDEDSIQVGDTIFLEFDHSTLFQDLTRNISVDYKEALNLGSAISFTEFLSNQQEAGAVGNFTRTIVYGKLNSQSSGDAQTQVYLFDEASSRFRFRLAIIPNKAGNYGITVHDAANVYTKSDECSKASFQYIFQGTDQHLYLLNQWRPGLILQEPGKSRVYYFRVD